MASIFVGTCVNEDRLAKALAFLARLPVDPEVKWFCVALGFEVSNEIRGWYKHVEFHHLSRAGVRSARGSGWIQPGAFLPCINAADDDVVITVDADSVVQRKLTREERARFLGYGADTLGVGWNAGPDDTLAAEFPRLSPQVTLAQMEFGHMDRPMFNTGVLVAKPAAYRRLCREYDREWPGFAALFDHAAKHQWLISWLLASRRFHVDVLGHELHTHGHYGMPQQCCVRDGTLYHARRPDRADEAAVYVRHHLPLPEDLRQPRDGVMGVSDHPEPLDLIALRTGTDKGTTWHGYTRLYEQYLARYGASCLLVEIGVSEGASLAMWRQWRPSWRVVGVDIDGKSPADFHGDGADVEMLPPDLRSPDIVIDDGSHNADDVIRTFLSWWPRVKPGGVYVVEDLHCSYHEQFTRPWHKRPVDFLVGLVNECMESGSGLHGAFKRKAGEGADVESLHFHKSIAFVFKKVNPWTSKLPR